MKNFFILITTLISLSTFADICICQYPGKDAKYGAGYKGEIGFYKMGCSLWLAGERKCRKRKILNVNTPLDSYLSDRHEDDEKIRVGFVGHWSSSKELVEYIKEEIVPINKKYKSPVIIENTACSSMEDTNLVANYMSSLELGEKNYIAVEGSQTTSIGMWDKVSFAFRKADLVANVDSRNSSPAFPKCEEYLNRRCTGYQQGEIGICVDDKGEKQELLCNGRVKRKKNYTIKIKKAKRWISLKENKSLLESYIRQEEMKLKGLMKRLGYKVNYRKSMLDQD